MVLKINNRRRYASRRSRTDEATVHVQTGDHKYQKPNRSGADPFEKLNCDAEPAPARPIGVSPRNSRQPTSPPMSPKNRPSPTKGILKEPSTKDDAQLSSPVDFVRTELSSVSIKRKVSFGPDVKPGAKDACACETNAFLSSLLTYIGKLECSAEKLSAGLMSLSVGMKACAGGASEESLDKNFPEAAGGFALANEPMQSNKISDDPIIANRTLINPEYPLIDARDTRESTTRNRYAGEREDAAPRSSDDMRISGKEPRADPLRPSTSTPRVAKASEAVASLDPTPNDSMPSKRSRFVAKKQRSVVEKNMSLRVSTTRRRRKKGKVSNLVMTGLARPLKKPMQMVSGGIKSQLRSPRMRLVLTAK